MTCGLGFLSCRRDRDRSLLFGLYNAVNRYRCDLRVAALVRDLSTVRGYSKEVISVSDIEHELRSADHYGTQQVFKGVALRACE